MVLVEREDKSSKSIENNSTNRENVNSQYECNICLDVARDAVISMCGHLFCWPCLHKWLETRPNNQTCPVCKSAISREKVIPLYGRNSTDRNDPRDKVPPRPQGQRTEPVRNVKKNALIYFYRSSFHISLRSFHVSIILEFFKWHGPGRSSDFLRYWCLSV